MAARFKMDYTEVAFQMTECGFDVVADAECAGIVAFCGGVSVRAQLVGWEPAPVWSLSAPECRTVDDVCDFLMGLRHPPAAVAGPLPSEPVVYWDGEFVFRLDPVAVAA
jgi:hypothetical protein